MAVTDNPSLNSFCGLQHGNEFHEPIRCGICHAIFGIRCALSKKEYISVQSAGCTHVKLFR